MILQDFASCLQAVYSLKESGKRDQNLQVNGQIEPYLWACLVDLTDILYVTCTGTVRKDSEEGMLSVLV